VASHSINSVERGISSAEELVDIVGRMQLSSIEDLSNSETLFNGSLDGEEVLISFDFYDGYGVIKVLSDPGRPKET
jgi:hypothetical protein